MNPGIPAPPADAADPHAPAPEPAGRARGHAPVVATVVAGLGLIFLAPLNPWWVPTGDSEVFLTTARNLYLGRGLVFNGGPVAFIPPGWPLVLAGAFHVTTTVLHLKLLLIACMAGFLLLAYATLCAFVPRRVAAASVLLAGLCSPLYPLTFWLHSDALMALIAGAAGLVAVRVADGRWRTWLLVALAALCGAGVAVRWAMIVQTVVIAALALGSVPRPDLRRRRVTGAGLVFVATFGAFAVLRLALPGGGGTDAMAAAREALDRLLPAGGPVLATATIEETSVPSLGVQRDGVSTPLPVLVAGRLATVPQWVGWTLFQPLRTLGGFGAPGLLVDYAVGGLALGLLALAALRGWRRGEWLWTGVLLYVVGLAAAWPHVNNRYLVPVLPYLVAGVFAGLAHLPWPRTSAVLARLFVTMLVLVNGAIWAVDVWVFRSASADTFYSTYEAGVHRPLVEAGAVLRDRPADGEVIAASERYENLGERWQYRHAPRVATYISGRDVISVPKVHTGYGVRKLQQWARDNDVTWYVHQLPLMPGRIWHFRVSAELHEAITGEKPIAERQPFELYRTVLRPTKEMPDRRWLEYYPYAVTPDVLDRIGRRIPGLPGGFGG